DYYVDDRFGRRVWQSHVYAEDLPQGPNAPTRAYIYEYSPGTGHLARMTYPESEAGGPRPEVNYSYDLFGNLTKVVDASDGTVYWELKDTNEFGSPTDERFGNGLKTLRDYDPRNGRP